MIAHTERLLLRPVGLEDAGFMCRLLNDPAWLRNIGDRGIRSEPAAQQYLRERIIASYETFGFGLYLTCLQAGTPIGLCGLVKRDALPDPDLGFALLPEHRHQGYAHEAASKIVALARTRWQLPRLLAIVSPGNSESAALLKRLGFEPHGTHRSAADAALLDQYLLQL